MRTAGFCRDVTYTQRVCAESAGEQESNEREREAASGSCALCRSFVVAPGLATWIFRFSREYFIWPRISGSVQFHLRRLAQRSIPGENQARRCEKVRTPSEQEEEGGVKVKETRFLN